MPSGPEVCFNGRDDNCNGVLDEGCGVPTGLLRFTIAWAEAEADVDLDVVGPKGELAEVGRVSASGLTKVRDCPGRQNDCKGLNMESVVLDLDDELTRGDYQVTIRLERTEQLDEPILVNFSARLGPKSYATEVRLLRAQDEQQLLLSL